MYHKCLRDEHCIGSTENNSVLLYGSDAQCAEGHTSALCAACLPGYKMMGLNCQSCGDGSSDIYTSIVIMIVIFWLAVIIYMICSVPRATKKKIQAKQKDVAKPSEMDAKDQNKMHGLTSAADGIYMTSVMSEDRDIYEASNNNILKKEQNKMIGSITILIGYLQIFSSLDVTIGVPWPKNFIAMIRFFQFINIDFMSVFANMNLCGFVVPFFTNFMIHMMILPTIIIVTYLATVVALLINRRGGNTYTQCRTKLQFATMFILYPSIGSKIFRIFQCIDVGDKKQYLKAALA